MEWRGLGSFQHIQGKILEFPIMRKPDFNEVFILHTN